MALDFLRLGDCTFYGPAFPEPYVRFELERALAKYKLLPDADELAGQTLRDQWDIFRRKLRDVSANSGPVAITNRILEPLVSRLGYAKLTPAEDVHTREDDEAGGAIMSADSGDKLRCWAVDYDGDLDSPTQRGHAYRFSPGRIAQRVLLATGERVGLLTNGVELRLLLCDPARPASHIEFDLNVWREPHVRDLPDGYQLLLALACPAGIAALPEIIEDARLKQNKVTKELRVQARRAIEEFVQAVLDHPDNAVAVASHTDKSALAKALWHEGLIVVYRVLFVLKCESTSDPSRVFRFASTPLWRNTYSPSSALARIVRRVLDDGTPSGRYLEDGLRVLFKLFAEGLDHPGLTVRPLGGTLFGSRSTPMLSSLRWGEPAVALLLNDLLWSHPPRRPPERIHYGPLDVEDLGRVYEALLELEPGIATEPMCRLRRQKLEVVVPAAQGEKFKTDNVVVPIEVPDGAENSDDIESDGDGDEDAPARGRKTKVTYEGAIAPGRFYLRVGLGRKSTGSFYTPHSFVRFLVQETIGPQCDQRSPRDNPDPGAILKLKVLDPACGSGHFLVEACRFLASRVYEAARLCDELATKFEHDAEPEKNTARKQGMLDRAADFRARLKDLPDQEDELLSYLPSRSAGAEKAVLSAYDIARAEAICRRLVAVHCLYGADLNPLAVELAKLSLWIESHAEGFPLTFLDHRIVLGNSLTGPFWEKLKYAPGSQQPVNDLFRQNLDLKLAARLGEALSLVKELEASVGVDAKDIAAKEQLKRELDGRLLPFRILAAAWSGGVMLGTDQLDGAPRCDDDAYADLLKHVGTTGDIPATIENSNLRIMIAKGLGIPMDNSEYFDPLVLTSDARPALSFDLTFPEVFHPTGQPNGRHGFDATIGNPPWDVVEVQLAELMAAFDPDFERGGAGSLEESLRRVAGDIDAQRLIMDATRIRDEFTRVMKALLDDAHGGMDLYACFAARFLESSRAMVGIVVPDAFHRNKEVSWLRKRLWSGQKLTQLVGFINEKKLFSDLPGVVQFDLAVIDLRGTQGPTFAVAFRRKDDKVLFDRSSWSDYPWQFANVASPIHLTLLEIGTTSDAQVCNAVYAGQIRLGSLFASWKIDLGQEVNKRTFGHYFVDLSSTAEFRDIDPRTNEGFDRIFGVGLIPLLEGKSIQIHNILWAGEPYSHWNPVPALALRLADPRSPVHAKVLQLRARLRHFRLMARQTCGSPQTNERSAVFAIAFPGLSAIHSIIAESEPFSRPNAYALIIGGLLDTFTFDFVTRLQIGPNLSKFILESIPIPSDSPGLHSFVAHQTLRLAAVHAKYQPLWIEQLGDAWREPSKAPYTWPFLSGDDERWAVRAAIDAVVANAYCLSREQYTYVLSTFGHSSYTKAPDLCLAAFDELKAIGLDAFCKKHDPYYDIPLVETLPKPVIDLSIPERSEESDPGPDGNDGSRQKSRKKRKLPAASAGAPSLFDGPDLGKVQAVKTLLDLQNVLTSAEVQAQLSLDADDARAILKHLTDTGLAVAEGKGKGTRYRLQQT